MNILSANQDTTTRFAITIEEINSKYKKEKEDLKRIIAETARSQAEQILADNDDDSMGNPEELCRRMAELRLQYNSIIVKQKQEMDTIMKEYNVEIWNNMGQRTKKPIQISGDDKIRLEVYDKYILECNSLNNWYTWHPNEKWGHDGKCYNHKSAYSGEIWFNNLRKVIVLRINEKRMKSINK